MIMENSPSLFRDLAALLRVRSFVMAWTDGASTQYDVLMTLAPAKIGMLGFGQHDAPLFVAIMRKGAFGFDLERNFHQRYIAEKLSVPPDSPSSHELAALINGIIDELLT